MHEPRRASKVGRQEKAGWLRFGTPERPTLILVPSLLPFPPTPLFAKDVQTKAELWKREKRQKYRSQSSRNEVSVCKKMVVNITLSCEKSSMFQGFLQVSHIYLAPNLSSSLSFLPPHFSRINLFRSGKVAVTTTPSRAKALRAWKEECRKRGEEKSQVIYSPLKEPPPWPQGERSGASILLPPTSHPPPWSDLPCRCFEASPPRTNGQIRPSGSGLDSFVV